MLDALTAAVDGLVDADPSALASNEAVVALHRELARLESVVARATARWDAESGWAADGARSGSAWLAARLRMPKQQAQRCLRLGRALRGMPNAEAAWLAGDIAGAQVSVLVAAGTDDRELVEHARTLSFRAFQRRVDYWRQANQPEDEERRAERMVEDRCLHLSQTFQGCWVLDAVLDPISGTIVADTLAAIERELFEADWQAARERLGSDPRVCDLARTPAQRRVDALVEMATRARTAPAGGRRPEPLFSVLLGLPQLERTCELANGTVITPGSLAPWVGRAWIERAVFASPSRVIDVGVRRRLFSGATRRAVELRDRECFHDLCEESIEQIDHIQPAAWGGPTRQDNGRGACAFHNRNRHHRPP